MVDMTMISEAVTSLKTASDIVKTLIGLKETNAIQTKVVELNGIILSAQSSALAAQSNQFTLLQRVSNLEKEIASLEAWNTEKQRYALTEIVPGVFTYRLKPEMSNGEPMHQICAACYQHGKPSILQKLGLTLKCPECKTDIVIAQPSYGVGLR
jgi:glycerol-3-phosphate responsive antiterminator